MMFESMVIAFAMYSKIPVPQVEWNDRNRKYCICFFPLIGVVTGVIINVCFRVMQLLSVGDVLRGCILTVLPIALTGGIHMDGFLDTSDAIGSWKTKEEKLEIMKDSHCGASALISGMCYMILYVGAMTQADGTALILGGMCMALSRAYSGLALLVFPKAKPDGLLRSFADSAMTKRCSIVMIVWIAVISVLLVIFQPAAGSVCALCAILCFLWYRWMSGRSFGGITGDLAGYFLQICELACLLTAVISGLVFLH